MGDALGTMGLVAVDPGVVADAILVFKVEGRALSAQYAESGMPEPGALQYTGAEYTGTAEFRVAGQNSQPWGVKGYCFPYNSIPGSLPYSSPADAPFDEAFVVSMVESLARVWGAAAIETLGLWTTEAHVFAIDGEFLDGDSLYVYENWWSQNDVAWLESVAAEATPRLLRLGRSTKPSPALAGGATVLRRGV